MQSEWRLLETSRRHKGLQPMAFYCITNNHQIELVQLAEGKRNYAAKQVLGEEARGSGWMG